MNQVLRIEFFSSQADMNRRVAELGGTLTQGAFAKADRVEIATMAWDAANNRWNPTVKASASPDADGYYLVALT